MMQCSNVETLSGTWCRVLAVGVASMLVAGAGVSAWAAVAGAATWPEGMATEESAMNAPSGGPGGVSCPVFVAHRGESRDRPENTMAAFRLAFERGVWGVESDVYLTLDGVPVILHDASTGRTAGPGADLVVAASTWDELKNVRMGAFGKWIGTEWESETIPRFEDYLALLALNGTSKCVVELKGGGAELVAKVAGAIRAQPLATKDRVIFLAFDPNLIRLVRQALPDYPAWLLLGKGTYNGAALLQAIGACNATGVDIDMESDFGAADVWTVKAAGYAFGAWTCDDPQEAFALAEKGVDAITANAASDLSAVVRPLVVETYFPDDTDTDGLPDEWETAYFGSPDDCTPLDDLDRDGFANIDEYRYGTDPGDPASRFVLAFANAPEGAERTVALTWPSVAGGVYSIWWSTDLAGGFELLVGGIPATPPRNVHPVAARGAVHFYRVTAALP